MKNKEKLIETIINGFLINKGKASCYCFIINIIPEIVYNIITRFHEKNPGETIIIVVDKYNTRSIILKYLNEHNITADNGYIIKILSKDFIKKEYRYSYRLCITINTDELDVLTKLTTECKFVLSILNNYITDNDYNNKIKEILPRIDTAQFDSKIKTDNIYSPVEEMRYGVPLSDEDTIKYNEYTNYINDTIAIFGSLDNIEKCKRGDIKCNISAIDYRTNLAKQNGWSDNLNTNLYFDKKINDIYNPNALFDRAANFYNVARYRQDLVTDNDSKLEVIVNICKENKDKKILIVSKRGEFAAKITKRINDTIGNICGDYHDCIDNIAILDKYGEPILIKSGNKKGEIKSFGPQAQSTMNESRFNSNSINVLSIKNASNNKLEIACDLMIITSPLCNSVFELKARFSNVKFMNNPTKVYKIYCENTLEHNKINKEKEYPMINVINLTENFTNYNEINGNIIL